ncbi:MAG TPA: YdeI/OmpD-associated family protein [Tepidisphaeraceae bacterium]|nr:YdeI/OmpD-associated family protein [Tepidisphaeraceae bacterium]
MPTASLTPQVHPKTRKSWRTWLARHHAKSQGVWLLFEKAAANKNRLPYADAVEEALCFGWIDATVRSLGDHTYVQWFCPRKPSSVWSKLNKTRVEKLITTGMMTAAGLVCIETAKSNGKWTHLDGVEDGQVPDDLATALATVAGARAHFDSLSPSARKTFLYRIQMVKRPETRAKKIAEAVECCAARKPPRSFFLPKTEPSKKSSRPKIASEDAPQRRRGRGGLAEQRSVLSRSKPRTDTDKMQAHK